MSHTPGEWSTCDRYGISVQDADGREIADCEGDDTITLAECQANARLLAAAPRLLAACQAISRTKAEFAWCPICGYVKSKGDHHHWDGCPMPIVEAAIRSALPRPATSEGGDDSALPVR